MMRLSMYIVLIDGPDAPFLGGSTRARNARVVQRSSAALCPSLALNGYGPHAAMLVPPDVALMPSLFHDEAFDTASRRSAATYLEASDGAWVVVGAASTLAALAGDTASLSVLPRCDVSPNTILSVGTPRARRRATGVVLREAADPTEGWVSRYGNRFLSRTVSRAALGLGLRTDLGSVLIAVVGLACTMMAARPGYGSLVAAGVLLQIAAVLGCVAREVARATLTESSTGARADAGIIWCTNSGFVAGALVGWLRTDANTFSVTSTITLVAAATVSLVRAMRLSTPRGDTVSFAVLNDAVRRAADRSGHSMLRAASGAFAMLRRDQVALTLFVVSLTGSRMAVAALLLVGIVVANVAFSVYGRNVAETTGNTHRRARAAAAR